MPYIETGCSARPVHFRKMFESVSDAIADINKYKDYANVYHSIYKFRSTEQKYDIYGHKTRIGPDYSTALIDRIVLDLDAYETREINGKSHVFYTNKALEDMRTMEEWAKKKNLMRQYRMCYDEKTEILTKQDGWILFKNLTKQHKVATLDKNHTMYFEHPSAIQKYWYNDKMIRINHRSVDLLVTPEHNMYVRKHWKNYYEFINAKKCSEYSSIHTIESVNWEGKEKEWFYFPQTDGNFHNKTEKLPMDEFLRFLGWFLSDGWILTGKYSNYYKIGIKQKKEKNFKEIRETIKKLGYKCRRTESNNFVFQNKQLWLYLKQFGKTHQKYIPREILQLSKRQLKILFDALMKGDGWTTTWNRKGYATTSKQLADDFQELCMKIGYNTTLSSRDRRGEKHWLRDSYIECKRISYEIKLRNRKERGLRKHHFSEEHYSGYVYDCTVEPYHTLLVRRNGKPCWSGNSGGGFYFIFGAKGHPLKLRDFELNLMNDLGVDIDVSTVGDTSRMMRVTNSFNFKPHRKRFCIPLRQEELELEYDQIRDLAKEPRTNQRFIYGENIHDFSNCKLDKDKIKRKKLRLSINTLKGVGEADKILQEYGWKVEYFCDAIKGILNKNHVGNSLRIELIKYLKTIIKVSYEDCVRLLVSLLGGEGMHSAVEGQAKYAYAGNWIFNPKKLKALGYCDWECEECIQYRNLFWNKQKVKQYVKKIRRV